jgi:hypothetical protein
VRRGVPQQKDLLTGRWRQLVGPQKEVNDLHIPLVAMLRWCVRPNVLFRHVPNGEHRDPRTAAKLKAMGVLPGAADLEFNWCEPGTAACRSGECDPVVGKARRVLHLELKLPGRQQSDLQKEFALAVRLLGDEYHVVRSIDEAINILGERGLLRSDVEVCGKRWR